MRKKILITDQMPIPGFEKLKDSFDVVMPSEGNKAFSYEEGGDMIAEFDVLLSSFTFKVDREILDKAVRLKLIVNYGVGYNNIDVAYATLKGIQVANVPDPVTEPTADHAMGLLLAVSRRITELDRRLRLTRDVQLGLFENLGHSLSGRTLGIIGFGRIGQAFARRAVAAGMHIVYHSRHRVSREIESLYSAEYVSPEELLRRSHVVSLNAPLTPETVHIIGAKEVAMMRRDAILINTARGKLIDEKALIEALQDRRIFGAGLDVYEEGETPCEALLQLDNVVLTPHMGTQTIEARIEMAEYATRNILHFFDGDGYVSRVNEI